MILKTFKYLRQKAEAYNPEIKLFFPRNTTKKFLGKQKFKAYSQNIYIFLLVWKSLLNYAQFGVQLDLVSNKKVLRSKNLRRSLKA